MKREGFDDGKAAGLAEGEKIKTLEMANGSVSRFSTK